MSDLVETGTESRKYRVLFPSFSEDKRTSPHHANAFLTLFWLDDLKLFLDDLADCSYQFLSMLWCCCGYFFFDVRNTLSLHVSANPLQTFAVRFRRGAGLVREQVDAN